jgi:hypothetical protein
MSFGLVKKILFEDRVNLFLFIYIYMIEVTLSGKKIESAICSPKDIIPSFVISR